MTDFNWSTLSNNQQIAFNPLADRLYFDDALIMPASIGVSSAGSSSVNLSYNGKSITLQTSVKSLTTSNVAFASHGLLVIGDNTTGASADDLANTLTGSSHDDQFIGLGGNDTIYGGAGNDTANFSGARSQHVIVQNPDGSFTVRDTIANRDGTDTLHNIENLSFSDGLIPVGAINLFSGSAQLLGPWTGDALSTPTDYVFRPNNAKWTSDQVWSEAVVTSADYSATDAMPVDIRILTEDRDGSFVYGYEKDVAQAFIKPGLGGTRYYADTFFYGVNAGNSNLIDGSVFWLDLGSASSTSYSLKFRTLTFDSFTDPSSGANYPGSWGGSVALTGATTTITSGLPIFECNSPGLIGSTFYFVYSTLNDLGGKTVHFLTFDKSGALLHGPVDIGLLATGTHWTLGNTTAASNYLEFVHFDPVANVQIVDKYAIDGSLVTSFSLPVLFNDPNTSVSTEIYTNNNTIAYAATGLRGGQQFADFYLADAASHTLLNKSSVALSNSVAFQSLGLPTLIGNNVIYTYQEGQILHLTDINSDGTIRQDFTQTLPDGGILQKASLIQNNLFQVFWAAPGDVANSNQVYSEIFDFNTAGVTKWSGSPSSIGLLMGTSFADTLTVSSPNSIVEGGPGADHLTATVAATGSTVSYEHSSASVAVDLESGAAMGGDAEGDVISGFANIIGSQFGDILKGDSQDNSFMGGGGDDVIIGGAGNDVADYAGEYKDFKVTALANGTYTVQDMRSGSPEGTDTLSGVEYLAFADQSIAVSLATLAITNTGGRVHQTTQTISGTIDSADAGLTVSIYDGATLLWTTLVDDKGGWSKQIDLPSTPGDHLITAHATDADGNTGVSHVVTDFFEKPQIDFNGDGNSDILLQDMAVGHGECYIWELNGTASLVDYGSVGWTPGSDWRVEGTGDFNGDGKSDILLQNATDGSCYIWELNGTGALVDYGSVGWTPGVTWQVVGTGDFNGDGKSDILLQNASDGSCYIWELNGTGALVDYGSVGWTPGSAWQVKGTGDFNGDGKSDILLQNASDGSCYIWEMNGTSLVGYGSVGWTPGSAWQVKGTGDFNGDGKSDILLQNAQTGACFIWELNNDLSLKGSGLVGRTPPSDQNNHWVVAATGDFNGDGKSDILLQNSVNGDCYIWVQDGTHTLTTSGPVGWTPPTPDWHASA